MKTGGFEDAYVPLHYPQVRAATGLSPKKIVGMIKAGTSPFPPAFEMGLASVNRDFLQPEDSFVTPAMGCVTSTYFRNPIDATETDRLIFLTRGAHSP